jgi:hypothetical protein
MSLIRKLNPIIATLPNISHAQYVTIINFLASCANIIIAMNDRDASQAICATIEQDDCDDFSRVVATNLVSILKNCARGDLATFIGIHSGSIPITLQRKIIAICNELPSSYNGIEFAQHDKYFCLRGHKLSSRHLIEHHEWSLANIEIIARERDVGFILINAIGMNGITYLIIDIASRIIDKNRAHFIMIAHDDNIIVDDKNIVARIDGRIKLSIMTGSEKKSIAITSVVKIL